MASMVTRSMITATGRRLVAVLLVGAGLAAGAGRLPAAAPGDVRPRAKNVVLIISDDQHWRDYGFLGHPHLRTPHLDRLARESLVFTRGYVPSSLCCPSLASIITGRYPHEHLIVGNDPPEAPHTPRKSPAGQAAFEAGRARMNAHLAEWPTLPKLLGAAGYRSLQTGKWWQGHFSHGGFDEGMTQGGRHGDDGLAIGRKTMQPAFDFMARCREESKPFMVWYAPMLPHDPHDPPQDLVEHYGSKTDSVHVARYWGNVERFDRTVGELLDRLDHLGIADDTLVVYVTDNGWLQDPTVGRFAPRSKLSPYDGGLRTPIMLRQPGVIAPRQSTALASSLDIVPTVLAACGVTPPAGLPGINLLDPAAVASRRQVYGECYTHTLVDLDDAARSLLWRWTVADDDTGKQWKLLLPGPASGRGTFPDGEGSRVDPLSRQRFQEGTIELFDVAADPDETQNVAAAHPDVVARLRQSLDLWWTPVVAAVAASQEAPAAASPAKPARLLCVTVTTGFRHASIPAAEAALEEIGRTSGLFHLDYLRMPAGRLPQPKPPKRAAGMSDADWAAAGKTFQAAQEAFRRDDEAWQQTLREQFTRAFAPEALAAFDGVIFASTTGNLPLPDVEGFLGWIKAGKAFIGFHAASDTLKASDAYVEMIGGHFAGHPWNAGGEHGFVVHDTRHPAAAMFPERFRWQDEIYQYDPRYRPENLRVLLSIDMAASTPKEPWHVPVAWVREYGQGRVFYSNFGHNEATWGEPMFRKHFQQGIAWALGRVAATAVPNPEAQAAEYVRSVVAAAAAATGADGDALRAQADATIARDPAWAVGLRPKLLDLRPLPAADRTAAYAAVVAEIARAQAPSAAARTPRRQPNIIYVMTDDQGYGDVAAHGNPVIQTPHLDRMRNESVRLTEFHVSPTCSPTRAALMTGRHEFRSGVTHTILERERLALPAVTLPQLLRRAGGYTTGIFGKWHLGDEDAYQPGKRGFDRVFIHGGGGIGQSFPGSCGDAPGNSYFDPVIRSDGEFVKTKGYCTDVFFDTALEWIDQKRKEDKPFFCYVATNAPHGPLDCPPGSDTKYLAPLEAAGIENPTQREKIAKFYGMIENIDTNMGKLLAKLDDWDLAEDTLVVFTTDNGTATGAPVCNDGMRGNKGSAHRGGTRVPAFWRWKGSLPAGMDVPSLTAHIDVLPTLCDIAGVELPPQVAEKVEGRSFALLLRGARIAWPDRPLVTHQGRWERGRAAASAYRNCRIREGRWQLVNTKNAAGGWELYDLETDPGEETDVASRHPDVVTRLAAEYDRWWASVQPDLVNENLDGPAENPFKAAYRRQFGTGPKQDGPPQNQPPNARPQKARRTVAQPATSTAAGAARRPNIVFFLCDDLGSGDIAALGSRDIKTPHIDALFARGTRLSRHWAGDAVCAPSRCVLMTGKHPGHAVVRSNREVKPEGQAPMPPGTVTLAGLLHEAGYATGGFGKWGLGAPGSPSDPVACGFDRFFGYNCQREAHTFYPGHLWDNREQVPLANGDVPRGGTVDPPATAAAFDRFRGPLYSADLIAAKQLEFVRTNAARPFFLYVPTTVPHLALQVPADEPSLAGYGTHFGPEEPYLGGRGYVPCERPLATYAAMITRMDREVGRLVALLDELQLTDDTIFVFTSDNGATAPGTGGIDTARLASNGSLRDWKGSPYEGGLRVPCVAVWPGRIPAGRVIDAPTGFEDWLPTLLDLSGLGRSIPADVDGVSLAGPLTGTAAAAVERELYRELTERGWQATVAGRWKAIRKAVSRKQSHQAAPTELYDLAADPSESRDLAAEQPAVVARLEAVLDREHVPDPAWPLPFADAGAAPAPRPQVAVESRSQTSATRPNILYIIVDDQSPFDFKFYNPASTLHAPVIERLAAEGMVFDAAYHMGSFSGAVCTPSRHMVMCGRSVWHLPIGPTSRKPKKGQPSATEAAAHCPPDIAQFTMAPVFNRAGYDTMRTCKQGNAYEAADALFTVRRDATKRGGNAETGSVWHGDQVMDYLADRERTKDADPFLIYFGFSHPHDTRDGTPELLAKYGATNHADEASLPPADPRQPPLPPTWLPKHPFDNSHLNVRDEVSVSGVWNHRDQRTIRNELGREYACSENIDRQIGRVLEKLAAMGELDNTWIFYTADHGIAIGGHGLQGKQNLYEHTWRVPFVVKGPGVKPGSRAPGNIYLGDTLATLCDIAGIPAPETNEGTSFLPVLEGRQPTVRDVLYGVYCGGAKPGMRSVRRGDWKLIKYESPEGGLHTQLFNLAENPQEFLAEHHDPAVTRLSQTAPNAGQRNLADDPAHAARRAEMEVLLDAEMRRHDDPFRFSDQAGEPAAAGAAVGSLPSGGVASAGATAPVRTARPNFVVIFIDDLGYGDIGPFGATKQKTPHLDRMAAEGMKLTSFYAAPVCSVSRAQLLTGCYGVRVGVPGVYFPAGPQGLNPAEFTIAERLGPLGYATACVGKWHLGDQPEFLPTRQGFDHYYGIPYSNDMQRVSAETGARVVPLLRDERVEELLTAETQTRIVEQSTAEAVRFIRASKERPFFLYMPHTAVHAPLVPGARFQNASRNGRFGDWVEEVDWSVGEILAAIRETGLDDDTLVIFTSDNGPWVNVVGEATSAGPLRGSKGSTWEGGVRVPTIARWPGRIAPGTSCDAVCGTIDLLPTLVTLAGGRVPAEPVIDGRDISGLLTGTLRESPRPAHYYFGGGSLQALRKGPWKLAIAPQTRGMGRRQEPAPESTSLEHPRLYQLDDDIGETTDVAADHPTVVADLRALAAAMQRELGDPQSSARRPAGQVAEPRTIYPTLPQPPKAAKAKREQPRPKQSRPDQARREDDSPVQRHRVRQTALRPAGPARPNIVLFLTDDLGYGELGCYGNRQAITPHLDRFAGQGVRLTDCHSASSVCSPSRSSLLTGRTPYRNGVFTWIPEQSPIHLRTSEIALPTLLRQAGYDTCHVGKWHLNGHFNSPTQPQPNDHGYGWWLATQNNAAPSHAFPVNFVRNGTPIGRVDDHSAPFIAREAVTWLSERRDRDKPFLLAVWTHEPHYPIASAERYERLHEDLTDPQERTYRANVTQLDDAFGMVMRALDEQGVADDTLVFFTSDNGPEGDGDKGPGRGLAGDLRGRKRSIYEGGHRVPGLIRWPEKIRAGTESGLPMIGSDFFPTALAAAGVAAPAGVTLDGVNLLPQLIAGTAERAAPLFWRCWGNVAYREGDWKLVADDALAKVELYNLGADVREASDLASGERERLAGMRGRLERLMAEIEAEGPDWWKTEPISGRRQPDNTQPAKAKRPERKPEPAQR
jgi:choline-sulfatase